MDGGRFEADWNWVLTSTRYGKHVGLDESLRALAAVAVSTPLRSLCPFTSLNALCFAKERPPARVEPEPGYIEFSKDGEYWVEAGTRESARCVCETSDPEEAVEALVRVLM